MNNKTASRDVNKTTKKRTVIFVVIVLSLTLIILTYFFVTGRFDKDLSSNQSNDVTEGLTEEDIWSKGYFFPKYIVEGVSRNLLGVVDIQILSYDVVSDKIHIEMLWEIMEEDFQVEVTTESFYFSDQSENEEAPEYILVDSEFNLENYLKDGYLYQGNFEADGVESFTESYLQDFLSGKKEFEFELKSLVMEEAI